MWYAKFRHGRCVLGIAPWLVALSLGCTGSIAPGSDGEGGGPDGRDGDGSGAPGLRPPSMPGTELPAAQVGAEFTCTGRAQVPGPPLLRRMTNREYVQTVRDLLGVDVGERAHTLLPRDHAEGGFTNDARAQTVVLDHVTGYDQLAEAAVGRLTAAQKRAFIERHSTCNRLEQSCFDGFLDRLGLRAFRRPLTAADRAAFAPILDFTRMHGGTYDEAAELALLAMLQSPRFLYLVETQRGDGQPRELDDYELASRLSFLLRGRAPDEALLAAAGEGALRGDGLAREIDRLLGGAEARAQSLTFVQDWLHLERLETLPSELARDMLAETLAVFERASWDEGRALPELFALPYTVASPALARHYGLAAPGEGASAWQLDEATHRRGILTHGSVLSAGGADASLVNRGLFVLETFLCAEIPPPPVGVNNGRPDTEPGKPQRWYAEQRASTAPCSNCHRHLDPLAYPLERFTGLGVARDRDEQGNDIDTQGVLYTPYDERGRPFADARQFAELLASDDRVRDCMILKAAQFGLGRALAQDDACLLGAMRDAALADGGPRYPDVLRALALQPAFRAVQTAP